MNTSEIKQKARKFLGKAGKKTVITVCTVMVLGCAVVLNVILYGGNESTEKNKGFALDLSTVPTEIAENASGNDTANTSVTDYFSSMTLSRKQARDEAMEVLKTVAESPTALEEARQTALSDINRLAAEIETEANIEMMVLSKGFSQCIAVLNGDSCNVIVESEGLLPTEIAQISEIVYEQSGVIPVNLKIIEKNSVNIAA